MKLGEKLKQTITELEQAKIAGLNAQAAADMEKVRRERADTKDWLENMKEKIVSQIEAGKVPLVKVENFDRKKWVRKAVKGKAANQDLWNDFNQYFKSEGLSITYSEGHCGMGMKDWINMTATVLPERPRLGGFTDKDRFGTRK